jgi:predicted RNA-binding Zn ribbon-like protein
MSQHSDPLALAFVNTLISDKPGRDRLSDLAQLRAWLTEAGAPAAAQSATDRALRDYRSLRGTLRRLFAAAAEGRQLDESDVDAINAVAARDPRSVALGAGADGGPLLLERSLSTSPTVQTLASIARSAIELLASTDAQRLGACAGEGCRLFFLAAHPARRWCDSRVCGNRARVARYAARRRTAK